MQNIKLFIRLARPQFLLGGILLYALGAGIVRYLGNPIDWGIYLQGQVWGTLLQLGTQLLNEYFDAPADTNNPNRTIWSGGSGVLGEGEGKLPRPTALWAGLACLLAVGGLTIPLLQGVHFAGPVIVFMLLIFLAAVLYVVPPIRLESSGYGELTTSVLVANLVPAFAFLLQNPDGLHRLLAMSTFPLTGLHMAMLLSFELPDYLNDIRYEKRTLMVRLGWQSGMNLHNILILASYLLLGIFTALGLPLSIALPAFLTLPLGLTQIYLMNRIAAGGKPNWLILTGIGILLFALTAYLMTFAFWTR